MKWGLFTSLLLLLVTFFVTTLILYELIPGETKNFLEFENNSYHLEQMSSNGFPNETLFYPNLRFTNKKISYFVDVECDSASQYDAQYAFKILENKTSLKFEKKTEGLIKVSCSKEELVHGDGFFIAGEGGPNSITNATNFYIINNATILLYGDNKCDQPTVAIHEILHALGFKHSTNKNSIMHEVLDCNQKITNDIIDTIEEVYSYPTLPDLIIGGVSASKSGKRLNFEVEILNVGLDFSFDSIIEVRIDGKPFGEYDIGQLKIGSGKIIKVSNLRVPRDMKEISFKVDPEERIFEIFEENNEKILSIIE